MKSDLKIFTENIDPGAVNQIYNLLAQPPFNDAKVRIMPDVHLGKDCVVGFTSTLTDKVIPNVIGVDIGCGMLTVRLGKIDIDLEKLDNFIMRNIPLGSELNKNYNNEHIAELKKMIGNLKCFSQIADVDKVYRSLGTLGGGNHFIEIDKDEDGVMYLVIHSGSRNLGVQVAGYYQKMAITLCKTAADSELKAERERLLKEGRVDEIDAAAKEIFKKHSVRTKTPNEFCYLQTGESEGYLFDLHICQEFAKLSRQVMAEKITNYLGVYNAETFETAHNYIDDKGIIRKGAIAAHKGAKVIIPMNMRDGCLIAVGKGNDDWNCSAPHGAGRLYKRSEVKEFFSVDEFKDEMKNVYSSTVNESTLDESPMAYKPMEEIVALIGETVEIKKIIKPIYNVKAGKR